MSWLDELDQYYENVTSGEMIVVKGNDTEAKDKKDLYNGDKNYLYLGSSLKEITSNLISDRILMKTPSDFKFLLNRIKKDNYGSTMNTGDF